MDAVQDAPAPGDSAHDDPPRGTDLPEPGDVPSPSWRPSSSAPRIPLTQRAIIEAALRVLDAEGIDGLSMRRVSGELGTGPASLYGHVRNKEELLQLLHEEVTGRIELPEPDPQRWHEQLMELGVRMRAQLNSHRDIARISLGRIPSGPTIARFTEWLFQLLGPVGIPDHVITKVGDVFGLYVGGYAFEESLGVASPIGGDLPPEQIMEMFRGYLLSLPVERFPNVHRVAGELFDTDFEGRFRFGVDLLLRGLQTYAEPGPPSAAGN